ncbi:putative transporter protein SLAC1/Mae1/ Ssu1/TehA [Helianthus anomalus]
MVIKWYKTDWYSPINKPASVLHWLNHVQTDVEYNVILDADMILKGPITPWEFKAARGRPAVRVNFFRGFKFLLAWWACTFPMIGAAIVTIRYTSEVSNIVTKLLSVGLTTIATITVFGLLVTTILHAFVMRDLFPNDVAVAISDMKPKTVQKWFHRRAGSSEKDIEHYLKYVTSNEKDVVEASLTDKDVKSQTPLP